MGIYIRAVLVVLVVGGFITWGFWVWKERTFATSAESRLTLMDKMETEGVPSFTLNDLKGVPFKSDQFPGKLVLINFWASWCAPCLEEFPSMVKLVDEMKGEMILIAVNEDGERGEIDSFLKSFPNVQNSPNVHVVWDENKAVMTQFEVDRLPESFLQGIDGKLVTKIVGSINWYSEESKEYVRDLLKPKK